jgi:protein-tyrosine phosphatase
MDRRDFITGILGSASLVALAGCGQARTGATTGATTGTPAATTPAATAGVERVDAAKVRVSWSGLKEPVKLVSLPSPDAPAADGTIVAATAIGGAHEAGVAAMPRPYFVIQDAAGTTLQTAERLLPLEGGRNFRDLGGYASEDGKRVRWGRLYRSGVMHELTDADRAYLRTLGIVTICDLRSADERQREPSRVGTQGAPKIQSFDYDMRQTMGSIGTLMKTKTREEAVVAFAKGYGDMAQFLTPHFTDMFARLAKGEAPLALNCSAGKDRTGLGSALILSALGVPRDMVIADYALSETYVPPDKYLQEMRKPTKEREAALSPQMAEMFKAMPEPVLRVLMGTDADVMRLTLGEIDKTEGGPVNLVKTRYGVTDEGLATMRRTFLV